MSEPRYVVREITGNSTRWSRETTDIYVLDSWYGFAVVASNARSTRPMLDAASTATLAGRPRCARSP